MRALSAIVAVCCVASVASAQPSPRISRRDDAQVRAAIRAVTREPILGMMPIYESHRVPGSIPEKTVEIRIEHGKVVNKPIIVYERTDRVSVRTGSDANLTGGSYIVQRVGTTWKVIDKSSWIH